LAKRGERFENRAEDTRLYARQAAWERTAWRPDCGRVAGERAPTTANVCAWVRGSRESVDLGPI
jgi:hypothetical protein